MIRKISVAAGVAALALLTASCQKLQSRDQLNKGVQAYKNAQYPQAVENFKKAVDLDPNFPTARLYLATAYMSQYIPGADSPENMQMAQAAHDQFRKVLEQDPKNDVAIASIASLYYNQKKFDEAKQWYEKLIAANPNNKEAYYTLGVIAWSKFYPVYGAARAKLGMKPEEPGPIKDKKVKEELKSQWLPTLNEGIKSLDRALEIDKEYDDAMAYENLLIRERADLDDDAEQYKKDIQIADDWVQKALQTKKIKAERKPVAGGITTETK
jgi:tetratricopeptide (TPR) repeat protein